MLSIFYVCTTSYWKQSINVICCFIIAKLTSKIINKVNLNIKRRLFRSRTKHNTNLTKYLPRLVKKTQLVPNNECWNFNSEQNPYQSFTIICNFVKNSKPCKNKALCWRNFMHTMLRSVFVQAMQSLSSHKLFTIQVTNYFTL